MTASVDDILDAAREVFTAFGARRANVDDIARAAGVSRSTLYRSFPTKDALLLAVIDRETADFFDDLDRVARDLPPQEAVVECFVRGMSMMRDIPVLGRLAQTEPEAVTGATGRGHAVHLQAPRIAATLRRSGATMPDHELLQVSELLLRLASTFLLDPTSSLDISDQDAVRDYAKRFLSVLVA